MKVAMAAPSTPPWSHTHKNNVQYHVGDARRYREGETQMGIFGGDKEALEHILQNEEGQAGHQEAAIPDGVVQHLALGTQQGRCRTDGKKADDCEQEPATRPVQTKRLK